ncbi:MAG: 50S ribosomal protein L23 [Alphaproteobacteria bacterium]|nr:50S ribosomal protein L23 [Alphaproteobacteria bacterium]
MAKAKKNDVIEAHYNTIIQPHITEKATKGSEHAQVTFKVAIDATKPQVKAAVEALFGVKVKGVNTQVQKGKTKRFKGILGRRNNFKKAIVTLEDGQTIDTSAGV